MKTKEHKFSDSLKFDRRLSERNVREGHVDAKDLERVLKALPDESNNVKYVDVFEESTEETEADALKKERLTFTS